MIRRENLADDTERTQAFASFHADRRRGEALGKRRHACLIDLLETADELLNGTNAQRAVIERALIGYRHTILPPRCTYAGLAEHRIELTVEFPGIHLQNLSVTAQNFTRRQQSLRLERVREQVFLGQ